MVNKFKIEVTFPNKCLADEARDYILGMQVHGAIISNPIEINRYGVPIVQRLDLKDLDIIAGRTIPLEVEDYHNHVPHYPAPTEGEIDGD